MKKLLILTCFLFCHLLIHGQNTVEVSFETQVYPTGIIPGIRWSKSVSGTDRFLIRVGYNWFRHRDLGVHDDERGGGFGATVGYMKYFNDEQKGWYGALKNDIWFNSVDWTDNLPTGTQMTGETSIIVLQPTAELGYSFLLKNDLIFTPTLAFGFEWNVRTKGEPTGEGAILLVGVQFGKRF